MTPGGARDVPFAQVATTQLSSYDGRAALVVGTRDTQRARIAQLVPGADTASGVPIAVFQGAQRTGGYAVRVDAIERDADTLVVHATFSEPPAGAVVTQILTSPAVVVSIAVGDATGIRTAILLDARGTERARADLS